MRSHGSPMLQATSLCTWYPVDTIVWMVAVALGAWARFDFDAPQLSAGTVPLMTATPVAILITGLLTGVYLRRYLPASFDEAAALALSSVAASGILLILTVAGGPEFLTPRSVPLLAGAFGLLGMWAARFVVRAMMPLRRKGTPVIVFGAGRGGKQLIQLLHHDVTVTYEPVALLDDNPLKRGLRMSGVRVQGTREDIASVPARKNARTLVIAVPSAEADLVRDLKTRAEGAGLRVLIQPSVRERMATAKGPGDLREINVNDLLGRQPISLDEATITSHITGKRVLVTGAGGSIGSELCRQIHRFGPAQLMMLDRDESALHAVQLSIENSGRSDIEIVFTGPRGCDKMHEELFGGNEERGRHAGHRLISHASVPKLYLDEASDRMRRFSLHEDAFKFMRTHALAGSRASDDSRGAASFAQRDTHLVGARNS